MFDKNWKKEAARDVLALGGIAFYFIVVGRSFVGAHYTFVWQIVIAAVLAFIASQVIEKADYHIARGLILVIFTTFFYDEKTYTIFAWIIFAAMILCSLYVWKDKKKLLYGAALGAAISALSYYLVNILGL
jgi:hypothetical protein